MRSTSRFNARLIGLCCTASLAFACQKRTPAGQDVADSSFVAPKPPKSFVRDIERVNKLQSEISGHFKSQFVTAARRSDLSKLPAFLQSDFRGTFLDNLDSEPSKTASVSVHRFEISSRVLDAKTFSADFAKLVQRLSVVQQSSFRVFEILVSTDERRAFIRAHWDIAGIDALGQRNRWNADCSAELVRDANEQWKLAKFTVESGEYVVAANIAFQDISQMTGLELHESEDNKVNAQKLVNLRQLTQSGGISVFDYNDDGYWDVLASRKDRAVGLFVNDGRGGFTKAKIKHFEDPSQAARFYLSVDLDNDGTSELVSTRVQHLAKGTASLELLKKDNSGQLSELSNRLAFNIPIGLRDLHFEGITACDVNKDNLLDIVVVGYSHWESLREDFNLVDGRDGLKNLIFINKGKLQFSEESEARGVTGTQYSYVSECTDFDSDGDVDIFVGNDYGRNRYYVNDGKGQFRADPNHPFSKAHGFSMGMARADYDNTGSYAVSISNMYSHAGHRILPLVNELSDDMYAVVKSYARGNALYEFEDGKYVDNAKKHGVELAEWAWGNIFFDVDNDADKDLYVVNGFTTHTDENAPDW